LSLVCVFADYIYLLPSPIPFLLLILVLVAFPLCCINFNIINYRQSNMLANIESSTNCAGLRKYPENLFLRILKLLRGWPAMMMHNRQQRHLTSMSFWEPLSYKLKQKLISSIDRWTVRISMSYPVEKMINLWWHKAHASKLLLICLPNPGNSCFQH